jgi:hypothetical protein
VDIPLSLISTCLCVLIFFSFNSKYLLLLHLLNFRSPTVEYSKHLRSMILQRPEVLPQNR